MRRALGSLAAILLELLARIPLRLSGAIGTILLPVYLPFRQRTRSRIRSLRLVEPQIRSLSELSYYRMRLRLALLSLRHFLNLPDGCTIEVEGSGLFAEAISSGNAVVLLGWHQGPVELLHRLPAQSLSERTSGNGMVRPFFLMTASAFSPALADWMARRRSASSHRDLRVVRPDETGALRGWARSTGNSGVLAVMVDQVPGVPQEWMKLFGDSVRIPYPSRLMDWIAAQSPECLAVSVRLESWNHIVFRYDRVTAASLKEEMRRLMEASIRRSPEQYNWSYPKAVVTSS